MFHHAITRQPGYNFADGLTTANLGRPTYPLMRQQHRAYVDTLRRLGLEVTVLEPLDGFPDAYFVEDVAVITPEIAVITIPGATERQREADHIAPVLAEHRRVARIEPPGLLEGGDVMLVGKQCYIGLSTRTNREGAAQLKRLLEPHGYRCITVPVATGLHLKSTVTYLGRNTLLLTEPFAGRPEFARYDKIMVDGVEAHAANTLLVNGVLLTPTGFPDTGKKLLAAGFELVELDTSEVRKMDGGLTCLSLRF